jgi:hypothetical protein
MDHRMTESIACTTPSSVVTSVIGASGGGCDGMAKSMDYTDALRWHAASLHLHVAVGCGAAAARVGDSRANPMVLFFVMTMFGPPIP